jgi:AcrR family transcriptional regulator
MAASTAESDLPPAALSRARVLAGAVALADEIGMESFTIRRLAAALDVKPMTIYHHVANKEAIVDGMVDHVFNEIDLPPTDTDWKTAIRHRAVSARTALAGHRWATPLMESRTTAGAATLRHHDAVLGCFRSGGFSIEMTAHAYALIDNYTYGFALQEANLPALGGEEMEELAEKIIEPLGEHEYPYLTEIAVEHVLKPGYNFGDEFEFGLDLILDALESIAGNRPGADC